MVKTAKMRNFHVQRAQLEISGILSGPTVLGLRVAVPERPAAQRLTLGGTG
jgi:hypothetical protein